MYFAVLFALLSLASSLPNQNVEIWGGNNATEGQFPFIVAITYPTQQTSQQSCDGVILNSRWILTSAGCGLYLFTGSVITAGSVSLNASTTYNISRVIGHEDYNMVNNKNDIALMQIEGEFTFDDNLQPIEIGEVGDDETCTVVGWGISMKERFPDVLQFLDTPTISLDSCKEMGSIWSDMYVGPESVCTFTGNKNISACYGDEGGPLVCDGKLGGIVSVIQNCGWGYPDVYVRTSFYLDWIQSHISTSTNTKSTRAKTINN